MEKIKIGLLAIIAVTLSINTYILADRAGENNAPLNPTGNLSNISDAPVGENNPSVNSGPQAKALEGVNQDLLNSPAKTEPNHPPTAVTFEKEVHDFGTIKQNSENTFVYRFKNTGTNPLIIESATGSCGCTVPNYPKDPILPGKTGDIEVVYRPGTQEGVQEKTVTVVANTNPKSSVLKLKAVVEKE